MYFVAFTEYSVSVTDFISQLSKMRIHAHKYAFDY